MSATFPPVRLPAKSLLDIELDEKLYKADFEVSARYGALSQELQRLALLGIGAYGFFIAKAGMDKSGDPTQALSGFVRHPLIPALGLFAFALSAACALFCNYLNSRCLKLQIDILRLIGRINSGRWDDAEERTLNSANLALDRGAQKQMLQRGRNLIFVAVVSLIGGAVATVVSFVIALLHAHSVS